MALAEGLIAKAGYSFINDIYSAIKGQVKTEFQKFDWHTAQINYYRKIELDYGTTRIIGKHEPISLEGIFTDVFLLDKPTAFKRFDIGQLQNEAHLTFEQNRLSGLKLVKKGELRRLYILGKPGAGKTTFLKYVALRASQNEINKIPIFVSLYDWSKTDLNLMQFLVRQFEICNFPDSQPLIEYILKMGLAIVLFDGLDETKQEDGKRGKIIDEIRNFSRTYDKSQILMTCRIAANDYTFEEFTYVEVADFTKKQVESYVKKWFSYDSEKHKNFEAEFRRDENDRLREMATTPLLLSLLCLNFEGTGTFPNRRVEIYEEGVNTLLSKWDSTRNIIRDDIYKGLSLGRKRQMFARIAAQTFENNEYFLSKNKLEYLIVDYLSLLPSAPAREDIDGSSVLSAIEAQHSIFIERAKNIYSFSHLTFQEYFTSKYIVDNAASGTLSRLLTKENIINYRWREVIINTVSLLDDADLFFDIFLKSIAYIISDSNSGAALLEWAKTKSQNDLIETLKYLSVEINFSIRTFLDASLYTNEHLEQDLINEENSYESLVDELFMQLDAETDIPPAMRGYAVNYHWLKYLIEGHPCITSGDFDKQLADLHFLVVSLFKLINSGESLFFEFKRLYINILNKSAKFDKNFYEDLRKLEFPQNIDEFQLFEQNLFQIIRERRKIFFDWHLEESDYKKLNQYFVAIEFLRDCLKLGATTRRKEIEENMLPTAMSNAKIS